MVEANLESIVITNVIGLMLLIGLFVTSYRTRERRHFDDRIFTALIFVCGGCCALEMTTWLVDGRTEPWAFALNYLGNLYCYLSTNIYAYLWVIYVDARLHRGTESVRHWYPGLLVPAVVLSLINLTSPLTGLMFTIDPGNVYSRQPLSYMNYVMAFVMLFYSVWIYMKYRREHGTVRFFPIGLFLAPVFVGAAVQAAVFGVSLAWTGVCIGLAVIHMSQQNELSYIDPLTNLYNRTYLDYALQSMQRSRSLGGGIMIDLDFFKEINDTYGHSTGDRALQQAAAILTESTPDSATVIRFAGDEFIVLMRNVSEDGLQQIEADIRTGVEEFNRTSNHPYCLSLSMGTSRYHTSDETPDEFLRRIDERMYAEKRAKHER